MILRKPYAFLIKHFKLMHIILSVAIIYLIYRTELMINFLNGYINSPAIVVGQTITSTLFNVGVILLPILIIVFSTVLLIVMTLKDKPKTFYILTIVVHVVLLIIYIYGYTVFSDMEKTILELKTIKALRDLLMYCILFQGAFSVMSLIRGVGFDIKKFNFGNDLQALEISEEDNEEFEVDLDFDINDKTRKGKRKIRYLKYMYKEHKFIVHLFLGLLVGIGLLYTYSNYNIYNKTSSEGVTFNMNGFTLGVSKSYITNTDFQGNTIGDGNTYLVVVDLILRNNGKKEEAYATGAVELNIAGEVFQHIEKYEGKLADLGIIYKNNLIGKEFTHYLLVYEIPYKLTNSKMKIGFKNTASNQTAYVKLSPNKLHNAKTQSKNYSLGDTINFKDSTLGSTTFKVNSYELRNKFTLKYNYCSPRKNCISSVEYLTPNIFNSNYDKTLLKLEAELNFDESFVSDNVKDIYTLFKTFAKIEYEIDGEIKYQTVYLGQVKSSKVKQNSTYYLEVYQEIKIADRIAIIFQVRNNTYKYYLK